MVNNFPLAVVIVLINASLNLTTQLLELQNDILKCFNSDVRRKSTEELMHLYRSQFIQFSVSW